MSWNRAYTEPRSNSFNHFVCLFPPPELQLPSFHTQNEKCFCAAIWLNKINLFCIFLGTLYSIYMSCIKICITIYFYSFFIALLVPHGTRTDAAQHPTRFHCKGNTFYSQMKLTYLSPITEADVTKSLQFLFPTNADAQSTQLHCTSHIITFQLKPLLNTHYRKKKRWYFLWLFTSHLLHVKLQIQKLRFSHWHELPVPYPFHTMYFNSNKCTCNYLIPVRLNFYGSQVQWSHFQQSPTYRAGSLKESVIHTFISQDASLLGCDTVSLGK